VDNAEARRLLQNINHKDLLGILDSQKEGITRRREYESYKSKHPSKIILLEVSWRVTITCSALGLLTPQSNSCSTEGPPTDVVREVVLLYNNQRTYSISSTLKPLVSWTVYQENRIGS
jgi:hypothetical protein